MSPLRLTLLFALFLTLPITTRASDVSGPESQELTSLAQLIQAYVNQNGHPPDNWSGIWNEDKLLKAKQRHPDLAPLYDRYSFVANRYPIVAKSGDDSIQGTILLMHNEVIDLAARSDLDNRTSREWWFVYLTLDNQVRVGSLGEAQLSSGNGVGRFRLLAPDLPQESVAAFEKKLITLGYSPRPKPRDPVPALDLKYATPASAPTQ